MQPPLVVMRETASRVRIPYRRANCFLAVHLLGWRLSLDNHGLGSGRDALPERGDDARDNAGSLPVKPPRQALYLSPMLFRVMALAFLRRDERADDA